MANVLYKVLAMGQRFVWMMPPMILPRSCAGMLCETVLVSKGFKGLLTTLRTLVWQSSSLADHVSRFPSPGERQEQ